MKPSGKRILWVDDEIDLLKPHLLFLQARGYHVDAITNGDDSLVLMRENAYDLVLLDEQMPGRSGLEVLEIMRREDPHVRVVMVTKSAEDQTMTDAIGRRVADYLVKPTSPRQVLSVVTRILEGSSIRQQRTAQDFAARFGQLSRKREEARTPEDFAELYIELTGWHVNLEETDERGLLDTVQSLMTDLRSDFGRWVGREYAGWLRDEGDRPLLSVDIVREHLLPLLGPSPVFLVVLDCMRLDQWLVIAPLLAPFFEIEESYHYSILPTATPYARNAIFSGQFPDEIARDRPSWWNRSDDEGSLNAFEDELLIEQLKRLTGKDVPVHYEKIFTDKQEDQVRGRVRSALKTPHSVVAMVFNFVDLMTHGRSESPILMEVAKDEAALRGLTRAWFKRSTAFSVLKEAAAAGHQVIMTTDHGSILLPTPGDRIRTKGRNQQPSVQVWTGPQNREGRYGVFDQPVRGPPFSRGETRCDVRVGCRRLLLRVSHQVEGIPAPVPQLVPARGHLPRGDDRPDCAPHAASSRLRRLTGVTLYTRLLSYLRPHLVVLTAAGAATFAFAALDASAYVLLIPFVDTLFRSGPTGGSGPDLMTRLLDATVYRFVDVQGDPLQAVQGVIVLILVVFLLKNVFDFTRTYLVAWVEQTVTRDLRNEVYDHVLRLDLSFFGRTKVGQITSRLTHDVEQLRRLLTTELARLLSSGFEFSVAVAFMLLLSWKLTAAGVRGDSRYDGGLGVIW